MYMLQHLIGTAGFPNETITIHVHAFTTLTEKEAEGKGKKLAVIIMC